jgi:starch phosphorylase
MNEDSQKSVFHLPERLAGLGDLAFNLWWSWHPEARMLFKTLDRQLWKESVHNPVKLLKNLPKEILEAAASDPEYLRHYGAVLSRFRHYVNTRGQWL